MKKILFILSMVLLMPNAALAAAPAADAPASTWLSWLKSGKPTREKVLRARQYVRSQWGCMTGRVQCSPQKKYALRALAAAVTAAAAAGIGVGLRAITGADDGKASETPEQRAARMREVHAGVLAQHAAATPAVVVDDYGVDEKNAYDEVMKAGKEISQQYNQFTFQFVNFEGANAKARDIISKLNWQDDKALNKAMLAGVNKAIDELIGKSYRAISVPEYDSFEYQRRDEQYRKTEEPAYREYKQFAAGVAAQLEADGGPSLPASITGVDNVDDAAFAAAGAADLPPPPVGSDSSGSGSDDDDDILIG